MKSPITYSARELARLKKVSKQTIYNNRENFDWEGPRIINNEKVGKFEPQRKHAKEETE